MTGDSRLANFTYLALLQSVLLTPGKGSFAVLALRFGALPSQAPGLPARLFEPAKGWKRKKNG